MGRIDAQLAQNQFLDLLVTQLQNQDPLDPITDQDFLGQLAQFSSLESLQQLNASFAELLSLQQLTQGSSLLGRLVNYSDGNGQIQSGTITAVTLSGGQIQLIAGDAAIPLDQVQSVSAG